MQISYYERLNSLLACSGQPKVEQFEQISAAQYDAVINLTTDDNIGSIANERDVVEGLGMKYFHLPVKWDDPQLYDVLKFFAIMGGFQDKHVWVHCTLNMRSSCFLYMYQKFILGTPDEEARLAMDKYCELNPQWSDLIEQVGALHPTV